MVCRGGISHYAEFRAAIACYCLFQSLVNAKGQLPDGGLNLADIDGEGSE